MSQASCWEVPLLGKPSRSSGREGLLLRRQHLGSLLIHLLHSLGPLLIHLLHSLGLSGLSCRPLLLEGGLSLSGQCSLLLGCLLLLHGSLSLLLLELLPSLDSGLCFVLVSQPLMLLPHPVTIPATVSLIPVGIP